MNIFLLVILGGLIIFFIVKALVSLSSMKVMISTYDKRSNKYVKVAYIRDTAPGEVPEVHLMGNPDNEVGARIKIGDKDDNAYIELLEENSYDRAKKFSSVGFIDQNGYVYSQPDRTKRGMKIGYTATPGSPNLPTVVGSRSWKTLWLKCQLNAYLGMPNGDEEKMPVGKASFTSLRSSKNMPMPPEARGAAYSMFFSKEKYTEYYNSPTYGWKDTALLSTFIYSLLYVLWYVVDTKLLGLRFVGYRIWMVPSLYFIFFGVWAIVRTIKIDLLERNHYIQGRLDLFNRVLGQRKSDIFILVCCGIVLALSFPFYRLNFVALAMAVITGVTVNMSLRQNLERWKIINPLEEKEEDENNRGGEPLSGDIERNYEWALDSPDRNNVYGKVVLMFSARYINDLRQANPFYNQRGGRPLALSLQKMVAYMQMHASVGVRTRYIASKILEICARQELTDEEMLQFTLDFCQEPNIRYMPNRDSEAIHRFEDYIRFPDETLFDKEADSNSKALLAATIFNYMDIQTVFLYSTVQRHSAIGIRVNPEWIKKGRIFGYDVENIAFNHEGALYIFCETTADGLRLGSTMTGMHVDDFDEKIILQPMEETPTDSLTCIYNWDLDSPLGNTLHGCYTLEFDRFHIDNLRINNPFHTYGKDGRSYDQNIRDMFAFIADDPGRMEKVKEIAKYIRETVKNAGLPEVDLVQFALDFCQEPNITYVIDEDSASINFAKEYMRFPDEVLLDKEGDCDCKSSLTAALFRALGYKVLYLISNDHAAIGVQHNPEWEKYLNIEDKTRSILSYNGTDYVYCETTGDGFKVGQIKEGSTISDFNTVIEL